MPATAGARSNDDPSSMNSQENSKVFRFGNALPSRQSTMRSAASQDHNRIRGLRHRAPTSMVGTNTSQTHSSIPFRQHSLSEGSSKAAVKNRVLLMQLSLASTSSYRITEPYMRTSDGVVFQDKKFQRKIAAKVERLIETALSPKSTERNALIAKKALKYREKRSRRPNLTTLVEESHTTKDIPSTTITTKYTDLRLDCRLSTIVQEAEKHMLRSVTRPIPKKNVCLSYWTFAVCWVLILGVHVLACIFNGIYAYCYWNLKGTYLNLCLEFYEIGMPEPYHPIIAIVHSAMFAIHGVCILLMVGGSLRQYSLAFTPWSTSTIGRNGKAGCALRPALVQRVSIVYNKIMYPCALCGVNGQYFDVGLICRQIIETALQTVHAYQMSLLLPRTLLNRFYVVLLAVNCWSSIVADLVFAGRDEAQRRFSCIVFDCLLDLMSSMGVRLFVLASYIGDYDPEITGFDDAIWYDDEWVARALNEFRMVAVVSWFDLVSRTIFTIGLVTTTTSMKQLLWRLPRKGNHVSSSITPIVIATSALRHNKRRRMTRHAIDRKIVRPRQQTARSIGNDSRIALQYGGRAPFRVMYLLLGTWGIVVLGLHIHSSCQPTLPQCFMQVKPWAVCRPSCYLVGLDCHMLSITGTKDEIEEKWSEFDASTVVQLLVRHCPKLAIPELFSNFGGLHGVKVYNTTIVQWDEAAALTNSNHPLISSLFLVRVNMTDGILPVGFQSSDFPQGLSDIEFCVTNLQSLPDDLATKWPRQGVIYIEYSRLTAVPQSLILLEPTYLAVTGNPITILPPELFEIPNMIFLGISYTEIEELPRNVTQLSAGLAQIYLIETNIAFFWSWIDEFVERTIGDSGGLQAAGSIYCYDLEMIEAATTSTFRTQILPALSTLLMTPTKENLKIILEAVSCSHDYDGLFYPLQFEDSINAMNTLLVA